MFKSQKNTTTIRIKKSTKKRLKFFKGQFNGCDSLDRVIDRLMICYTEEVDVK